MNQINIDSYKVEANDSIITGSGNMIFGNGNKVIGDRNKVYGNNNTVSGNENIVKGENNICEGTGNEVVEPFGFGSKLQTSPSSDANPRATSPTHNPFSTSVNPPANPFSTSTAMTIVNPRATSPVPMNTPMNAYPSSTSPTPFYAPANNNYFAPIQAQYNPSPVSPRGQQPYSTSPVNNNAYFPSQALVPAPQQYGAYPAVSYVMLSKSGEMRRPDYIDYIQPTPAPVNPFEAHKEAQREKNKDLIQDGTMVFMINEWESESVREFCQLVAMTSGQQVGWHVSCGRTCIVGLGNLEKIREAIIQLLPQLNNRLCEWSWNTFGNKVCPDRDLYAKRLFKEYTREHVDCWRENSSETAA